MKPELEAKLFEKYPDIFVEKDLPMNQTCMCWGIECGDGWYDLLDRLCEKIESVFKEEPDLRGELRAVQVKEKYGGLRFYMNYCHDKVEEFIREAEDESERTCEACGSPGEIGGMGWISCLCDECRANHKK
jgi:hypothetical protein